MPEQRKGRLQLILVAAVFFGPLLLAWLLYEPGGGALPIDTTAHGELITPVRLVPDASLRLPPGELDSPYPGHWTLVHVGNGSCDEQCAASLYETRQVRKSLGKEDRRVQRIFFLLGDRPLNAAIAEQHPGLAVYAAHDKPALQFMAAIEPYDTRDVFLVDPLGNLIMRFPPGTGMQGMQKDLKKLLKISSIG